MQAIREVRQLQPSPPHQVLSCWRYRSEKRRERGENGQQRNQKADEARGQEAFQREVSYLSLFNIIITLFFRYNNPAPKSEKTNHVGFFFKKLRF